MGRRRTLEEQKKTVEWAQNLEIPQLLPPSLKFKDIQSLYLSELKEYFALAALSRSKTAPSSLVLEAWELVFSVRVKLERALLKSIDGHALSDPSTIESLFSGNMFGASKKQGVSLRFALTSCQPTKLCGAACYAHDVLDATPAAVTRGAINSWIASSYEIGFLSEDYLDRAIGPHCNRAIAAAIDEAPLASSDWQRRPYIRLAHVGELSEYPAFANYLGRKIKVLSKGGVDSVVYTRHKLASALDPQLFVVNFTLDGASSARAGWKPPSARLVYSAFDGDTSVEASVNFLEHHRWTHIKPKGQGNICPVTLPETETRSCDAVRCDLCFKHPK